MSGHANATQLAPRAAHLSRYRPDIDGLRAIAVLLVIGFHAFPNWITGGFVGVDIFFVISGFLISSIIFENLENANFSYIDFYSRRISRIFPALALVLCTSLAIGWFGLLPDEFQQLGKHIASGAGFVSNFALWNESGYFDSNAESKPLLHLWSLGIEEQFYILWPLAMGLVWKRKWGFLRFTTSIWLASFVANIIWVSNDPVGAFYSPITRFWELMVGGILAYISLHKSELLARGTFQTWQCLLGLCSIAIPVFFLNKSSVFPGWWALFPTCGAFLVISAGPACWINKNILGNRVIVWVGLISYPLYLWHWPLLSFSGIFEGATVAGAVPSRAVRILAIGASILLAWATYKFVERPVRQGGIVAGKTLVLIALMISVLAAGSLAWSSFLVPRNSAPEIQALVSAYGEWEYPGQLKHHQFQQETFYFIAGESSDITLLIGDSHIEQYGPLVVETMKSKWAGTRTTYFVTDSLCPPIPNIFEDKHKSCDARKASGFEFMENSLVKTVVIGACWNCYFIDQTKYPKDRPDDFDYYVLKDGIKESFRGGRGKELALIELERLLKNISKTKKAYLLLDNPSGAIYNPKSYFEGNRIAGINARPISPRFTYISQAQKELNDQLLAIAIRTGTGVINPMEELCRNDQCIIATESGDPIYKDMNHLRPAFVRNKVRYWDSVLIEGKSIAHPK